MGSLARNTGGTDERIDRNDGGSQAQYHLRHSFVFLNKYPVNRPEIMVGNAAEKFDAEGRLLDASTKDLMAELLKGLVDWTLRLKGG
jgi:chromate reductase